MTPPCFRPLLVWKSTGLPVLFRSSILLRPRPQGTLPFAALGLHCAVDLRTPAEIAATSACARLFDGVEHHRTAWARETERLEITVPRATDYADWYERMLATCAGGFAWALLRSTETLPRKAVLCCTQGKDRTGLVAAALLEAAGVSRELILHDYERSPVELASCPEALRPHWERRGLCARDYLARYGHGAEPLRQLYERLPVSISPILDRIAAGAGMPELAELCREALEPCWAAEGF